MNLRERLMLFGVVGLAVVFLAKRVVTGVFIDPLRDLDGRIAKAHKAIGQIESETAMRPEVQRRLNLLRRDSLPDNLSVATSQYQQYLNERLQEAGLTAIMSPPSVSRSRDNYTVIRYTLSGKGTLGTLTRFLYLFHRDPLLQQIETLRLNQSGGPESTVLSFSLKATAMAMGGTGVRARLVPADVPDDERAPGVRLARLNEADFAGVVTKNIFRRGWTPPPPPLKPKKKTPAGTPPKRVVRRQDDPNRYQRVKGMTDNGSEQVAWIEDTRRRANAYYRVGDKLTIGQLAGIDLYQIVIKIGDNYYKVRVGKTLAEREALTADDRQRLRDLLH